MGKRMWEYKNKQGYKYLVTKQNNGLLKLEVVTFSALYNDWASIDELKDLGVIDFIKEYEIKEIE